MSKSRVSFDEEVRLATALFKKVTAENLREEVGQVSRFINLGGIEGPPKVLGSFMLVAVEQIEAVVRE